MSRTPALVAAALLAAMPCWPKVAPQAPGPTSAAELLDRLETAWEARDLDAYLGLWRFDSDQDRALEAEFAKHHFGAASTRLHVERPEPLPEDLPALAVGCEISSVTEPRGRYQRWLLGLSRGPEGFRLVGRQFAGELDGLLHLSLDPQGYRAGGLTLTLEDFVLRLSRGTLFMSPAEVGPTVLVFVGEGKVLISPRPATERRQLELFCGRPTMATSIRSAFIRLHPANFRKVLQPIRLSAEADSGRWWGAAQKVFDRNVSRSFLLDAPIPGSPWWVLPAEGDASVTFETRRHGTLTFAVNGGEPESINLFDREARRQILLYPSAGGPTDYDEDEGRATDVTHHELEVRFEPSRDYLEGRDTLQLRVLRPAATLRLDLDQALEVRSVRSEQAGRHLFFRVRDQNAVLVSLGPLSGSTGDLSLTVEYAGRLAPVPVDSEALQIYPDRDARAADELAIEPAFVYSNQRAWYPRTRPDDYATAVLRLDVPDRYLAVTGGEAQALPSPPGRRAVEHRQGPGRYFSAVVGRLSLVDSRPGPPDLTVYALPRLRGEAEKLLPTLETMLSFFQQELGPFPYPTLSLCLVEGRTPGGHSPPGMVVLQRQPLLGRIPLREDPASFDDIEGFFLAHELAHQWWGHGVAGQSYHERWLSEAMAQYAAALWARHHHGEETFVEILEQMGRWARRYSDRGPICLGYRLGHIEGDPRVYRAIVYDKGAYVLHMLRSIVGEAAFRQALTGLQAERRFQKIGTYDLQQALESAAGLELDAYFRAWVFGTALPRLSWDWRSGERPTGHRTEVRVEAEGLPGPVPLDLVVLGPAGEEARRERLEPAGGRFVIETPWEPRDVRVNGDLGLLAEVDEH